MRPSFARVMALTAILGIGVLVAPVGYGGPEEPSQDLPLACQGLTFATASVVVLNANDDAATTRRQISPQLTALLAMTKISEGEKCDVVVLSGKPNAKCVVVTSKSDK